MKKYVALALALVLVFSMGVPSFAAVTADQQATTLQSGWGSGTSNSTPSGYTSSWFARVLYWLKELETTSNSLLDSSSNIYSEVSSIDTSASAIRTSVSAIDVDTSSILSYIQDIAYDTSLIQLHTDSLESILDRLDTSADNVESYLEDINKYTGSIDVSLSNIESDIELINLYLVNTLDARLTEFSGYFSLIKDDVSMLQQVLADEDDLAFKQSQKENQALIQDTFFTPGNDLSLDTSKITEFTQQFTDFTEAFDFSANIPAGSSPLDSISEGSEFSQWFTTETGQDMDPTFGGGSGGGGGENPDPDPDPEPEPIKNWLPLATSEPGGSEIYNGIGYLPGYRWSNGAQGLVANPNTSVSGYIPLSITDEIYFYGFRFIETTPFIVIFSDSDGKFVASYNVSSSSVDENDVYSFDISDFLGEDISYFRFVFFTETAISGIVTINQYPIQTVSTFSLRSVSAEPEIVTTAYADRMSEYKNLLRGGK